MMLDDACIPRNYLRVRGEYFVMCWWLAASVELPPRARRIRLQILHKSLLKGTTSACAENTPNPANPPWGTQNYLRVRGEYVLAAVKLGFD